MTPSKKKPYVEAYENDRERYDKEMQDYEKKHPS